MLRDSSDAGGSWSGQNHGDGKWSGGRVSAGEGRVLETAGGDIGTTMRMDLVPQHCAIQ